MTWIWNYGNDRLVRMVAIKARKKGNITFLCTHTEPMLIFSQYSITVSSHGFPSVPPAAVQAGEIPRRSILLISPFIDHYVLKYPRHMFRPSNLGLASLTLTDVEEEVGKEQLPHRSDTKGTAVVSPIEVDAVGIARLETTNVDVKAAGVASIGV